MKTHVVLLTALLSACSFNSEKSNSQASSAENSSGSLKSIDFSSLNSFKLVFKQYLGGLKPATVDLTCTNSTDARVVYIVSNKQGSKIMANAQTIMEGKHQLNAGEEGGPAYMQMVDSEAGYNITIGGGDLVKAYNSSSTILSGEARFNIWNADTDKSVRGTCKGLFSFEARYQAGLDEIVFTKSNESGATTFDINYHQEEYNPFSGAKTSETTTLLALNAICASGNFDVVSGKTGSIDCKETKPQTGTLTLNVIKADLKENGKYTAQLTPDIFGPLPEGLGVGPVEPRILGEFFDLVILK